jgi:titin
VPAKINLAWTAKSHNETGFQIYRSNGGTVGFYPLTSTAANVTNYSDIALQPVNEHCYYVEALAKGRVIGVSGYACAKPPVTPPAASNASAIPQGTVVNIAWTDNSVIESGFRIEVAGSTGGPWSISEPSVGAGVTSAQRSAAVEVLVCYHVVAFNEFGDAAASNAACTTPLAAPTLTATAGQYDREIKLTWSDNSSEEWYEISRSTSGGEWLVVSGVWANTTEYLDQNLNLGTEYSYRVRAMKGAGFSDYSNTAAATAVSGPPRAPGWVYTYVFGSTGVEVYWEVPYAYWEGTSNITGWKVERSPYGTDNWTVIDAANTSGYYDDWGLTPEETVCYRVSTLSAYGESEPTGGDYACATPTDYCYWCGAENASIGVNAPGSLLNRQTPLLNFGPSKSAAVRAGGAKPSGRPIPPSKTRVRRTP